MQKNPILYSPNHTQRVSISFPEKGRTKQSHKDECNINNIMAKFQKTGMIDFVNNHQPQYGDVSDINYQSALDDVRHAQSLFDGLPSSVRKRFDNDPGQFLEFCNDPNSREEAVKLGLIKHEAMRKDAQPRKRRKADSGEAKPTPPAAPAPPAS